MARGRGGNTFILHKFVGKHPDLVSGNYYNLRELSEASGVNYNTLHTRIKRYPYKDLDDGFLEQVYTRPETTMFETKGSKMMDTWLRKPPLSIDKNYPKWR